MTSHFPKQRTAFLVIHGIGERNPFETLDSFARGLIQYLRSQGVKFTIEHQISERKSAEGSSWIESHIRLLDGKKQGYIDVHEYYWAYLTEEKISFPEIWQWAKKTLDGAVRFAEEKGEIRKRVEGQKRPYWWRMRSIVRVLRFVYPLIRIVRFILPRWSWLSKIREMIEHFGTSIIVGYIGDIAIYTTTDQKSRYYKLRQQILSESQALLEALLLDKSYKRIIIAGHSLGSVIAYDTLNRLNIKVTTDKEMKLPIKKLAGLITFGSPLDKIAFFFSRRDVRKDSFGGFPREHAQKNQYIRRQILEHLHSFKAIQFYTYPGDEFVRNPITPHLDTLLWINFYDDKDPISGHLDYYKSRRDGFPIDEESNIKLQMNKRWGAAHVGYWEDEKFYNRIVESFLSGR